MQLLEVPRREHAFCIYARGILQPKLRVQLTRKVGNYVRRLGLLEPLSTFMFTHTTALGWVLLNKSEDQTLRTPSTASMW